MRFPKRARGFAFRAVIDAISGRAAIDGVTPTQDPPIDSHAASVPLESRVTPGCPRCEEMDSTCGICLAATMAAPAPAPAAVDVADAAGSERISQVCAMGFSREAATNALELSGQSVEGAIDLLLSQA